MDADDVDRVVQNLMAEHEAASASAHIVRHPAGDGIAVVLEAGTGEELFLVVDEDGDEFPHPHLLVSGEQRQELLARAREGASVDAAAG